MSCSTQSIEASLVFQGMKRCGARAQQADTYENEKSQLLRKQKLDVIKRIMSCASARVRLLCESSFMCTLGRENYHG